MPPGSSGGSITFNLEMQNSVSQMPPRFIPAECHLYTSGLPWRKEVSLPPDKPGGIPVITHFFLG